MDNMLIPNFSVSGFRAFQHLTIERFGRVNLIVGRNNSGKSSLLEAIRLHTQRGAPRVLWDILSARDELTRRSVRVSEDADLERVIIAVEHLFYGREFIGRGSRTFRTATDSNRPSVLEISLGWLAPELSDDTQQLRMLDPIRDADQRGLRPALSILFNDTFEVIPLDQDLRFLRPRPRPELDGLETTRAVYVSSNGMNDVQVARAWDSIALTDLEEDVLSALRIISPSVQRLSLIGDRESGRGATVVVRMPGLTRPVPLRSMGDGMNRILGIALALVNARDGILLIDEIENGIHYAAQAALWNLIFLTARRLNIQVFATTHGWDCISAFQAAANSEVGQEAILLRLEGTGAHIRPTLFTERELGIVTQRDIEVR